MERSEIERALEAMGGLPDPEPDEFTIARLQTRWREAASSPRAGRAHRRRPALVATTALVVTAAAAAAALALAVGRQDPGTRIVVAEAEDIVILLPDGEVVDPVPGVSLPDGAVVQAGPYAAGLIGGNPVGPDDIFKVVNGRLTAASVDDVVQVSPESSSPRSVATAPPTRRDPPSTADRPAGTAATTTASTATTITTSAPATTTTLPAPSTPSTPPGPATDQARQPATSAPSGPVGRLKIRASVQDGTVVVGWTASTAPEFRRYVVYRVRGWSGTGIPQGGRLATITERSATEFVDEWPTLDVLYVVAVIGEGQRVLAIGAVRSPQAGVISEGAPTDITW